MLTSCSIPRQTSCAKPSWRRSLPGKLILSSTAWAELFGVLVATLGEGGKISVVGRSGGVVPEFNTATLFFRRNRIGGVSVGSYTRPEAQAAWRRIVPRLDKSNSAPVVDQVFPFEDVKAAFRAWPKDRWGKCSYASAPEGRTSRPVDRGRLRKARGNRNSNPARPSRKHRQLAKEVVALIVDQHKCRKVHHLDLKNGFHP